MKTLLITQARFSSTRFPGKVLAHVLGKPVLQWHLEACLKAKEVDEVVCAVADELGKELIEDICRTVKVPCVFGPVQNVLSRYAIAAAGRNADIIVRVTSDCPLVRPELIDRAVREVERGADYASNILSRTFPKGYDVEAFTYEALRDANEHAAFDHEREHVTPWMKAHCDTVFNIAQARDCSELNLSVDTVADLVRVRSFMLAHYDEGDLR